MVNAMTIKILLRAALKKQRNSLCGVFCLVFAAVVCCSLAVTMLANSSAYLTAEMERLGYGTLTAWVSGCEDIGTLQNELAAQNGVQTVTVQPLVFAGYSTSGGHSDNDGQLLAYKPEQYAYRFFNDELDEYSEIDEIEQGEIYISPAMQSAFGAQVGDTIYFELSRENAGFAFTVAGFFEDPFMGSSMVDMKSFLICPADYEAVLETLQTTSDFNRLGRAGAMLHIFADGKLTTTELNRLLNENTSLGSYTEMTYSADTIRGFMLLLQNVLSGFLLAFAVLLLAVVLIILANAIRSALLQQRAEFAILKTVGCSGQTLRLVQACTYCLPVLVGVCAGMALVFSAAQLASGAAVTSTGLLLPAAPPLGWLLGIGVAVLCSVGGFAVWATRGVLRVRPLEAIRTQGFGSHTCKRRNQLGGEFLSLSLAVRQLLAGWKSYAGVAVITAILTLFASVVGAMSAWVGSNGEGLMDSFSVAEHDIGIQPTVNSFDFAEVEALIESHSPIAAQYQIAMQSGSVNGVSETINVLDKPQWFHILSGKVADAENELVVTEYVAGDLGVGIGDSVSVSSGGQTAEYQIVGIYECANGMGANVGMSRAGYARIGDADANIWCRHYILEDSSARATILDELNARYRLVADIHDNSWSGLDGIVNALHSVIYAMYAVTVLIVFVAVALSARHVLTAEQKELATYKSIGFAASQLRLSFALRYALAAAAGCVLGMLLAAGCAGTLVAQILKLVGIAGFYAVNGAAQALPPAACIAALAFGFAYACAGQIKTVSVTALLREE